MVFGDNIQSSLFSGRFRNQIEKNRGQSWSFFMRSRYYFSSIRFGGLYADANFVKCFEVNRVFFH